MRRSPCIRDSRRARRLRVGVGLLAGCAVLAGCVSVRPLALAPPDRVAQTSLVLDAGGRTVAALHGPQDRTAVPLAEVSRWMRLAVVDTEDARFWRHHGVDWLAVARAAARDLERGEVVEGGSAITQQYVKNTYVSGEQTLRRKLAEAGHAWGLERGNAKAAILEAYLNTVYFGQGAYGVEAAAQTYFSTSAGRLTLAQAALLAAMIRAPVTYDPFRHPRARADPPGHGPGPPGTPRPPGPGRPGQGGRRPPGPAPGRAGRRAGRPAPWFVGWVLDQLLDPADHRFDALGTSRRTRTARVFTGGLRIATTVDLPAQAAAERSVASVTGRRAGDPYGALVALEPGTGAVRAMVGGRSWWGDPRFGRVNLATGAGGGRPAGSAFKPFALVAALEQGIPPEAVFAAPDRLAVARHGRGPAWPVANYEGHGFGHASLRSATALSISTVYAGLLVRLGGGDADRGAAAMVRAAARLGVAEVVDHGTGVRARIGRPAAGKTGTTQDHADAWFVGFTPTLATAVWVGYPQGQVPMVPPRTAGRVSGGTWPAAIWAGFMRAALAGRPPGRFPRPDTRLVQVALDVERGCLPNRFTPAAQVASLVYLKAAAPTRTCREPEEAAGRRGPGAGRGAGGRGGRLAGGGRAVAGPAADRGRRGGAGDGAGPVAGRRDRPARGDAGHPDRGRGRPGGRGAGGDAGPRGPRPARAGRPRAARPARPGGRGPGRLRRRPGPGRGPAGPGLALRPRPRRPGRRGRPGPALGQPTELPTPGHRPRRPDHHHRRRPVGPARIRSGGPGRGGPGRCGGWPRPGPARGGRRRR
jgi:membrane peptidoglycan carboxypeptidase